MTDISAALRIEDRMQNGTMPQDEYERMTARGVVMVAVFGLLERRGLVDKLDVGPVHVYALKDGIVMEAEILAEVHEMLELGRETIGEFKPLSMDELRASVLGAEKP